MAETTGLTDAEQNKQNQKYRQDLAATQQAGLEGNFLAQSELALLDWARTEALGLQQQFTGQTIQLNGKDVIANGDTLQLFQATEAQYNDSRLYGTVQREILLKQYAGNEDREAVIRQAQEAAREESASTIDLFQAKTLERFKTPSGTAATDTTDLEIATLGIGSLVRKTVPVLAGLLKNWVAKDAVQTGAKTLIEFGVKEGAHTTESSVLFAKIDDGLDAANSEVIAGETFNRKAITEGFQDHHIISDKNALTKSHELLDLSGFNLETRSNKIFLPESADLHPTRSIHSGRHTNSVSQNLANQMDAVVDVGRQQGWSQQQYRQALDAILAQERAALKAGDRALNKNARPWAQ